MRPHAGPLDAGDFQVETKHCEDCRTHYARVTGYVHQDDITLVSYYAVCHGHPDHEVSLDVTFGSWGSGYFADHQTFSCRIRPGGAMVVDPFVTLSFEPGQDIPEILGRPVPRDEALDHELLASLWRIVDALVVDVAPIAEQFQAR
jgi:hypothetical protein